MYSLIVRHNHGNLSPHIAAIVSSAVSRTLVCQKETPETDLNIKLNLQLIFI